MAGPGMNLLLAVGLVVVARVLQLAHIPEAACPFVSKRPG